MQKRLTAARPFIRFASTAAWMTVALCLLCAGSALAQVTVYDDVLQNSFQNFSYGGGSDFASTAQFHGGQKSIALTGINYNAISFARAGQPVSTADSPVVTFWVHGGASGGQQLRIYFQLNNVVLVNQELDTYISGGAIVAGAWRQVTLNAANAPFNVASYDRIDIQSDIAGPQPVLYIDDVTLQPPGAAPAAPIMSIEHDVTVASLVSDRFTWNDASGYPRVAVLAHNDVAPLLSGPRGGALREFRYRLPNGATRIADVTTYGNGGYAGFGYVVSHASRSTCVGDDSPLGAYVGGTWTRVFEGRHHAIFRFTQNYPRNCSTTPPQVRAMPVVIDWVFSTGRDNPLWATTFHVDQATPSAPVNTFWDDSRAPYGELNIDGQGALDISGVAWGDRFKFFSTAAPVTLGSSWTWNVANTVPWVKLWIDGPLNGSNYADATMGIVQTQTLTQQDAAGGRDPDIGADMRAFWNKTSANGAAGPGYLMPDPNYWPYQANGFSIGPALSSNNARLTWRTQYGFLGQQSYAVNDNVNVTAPGYPKKSYSTWIVLGTHTSGAVESQLAQVETIQSLNLTSTIGSVVASGPAGIDRADSSVYVPPGYNHVYGALAFTASGNHLAANISVGNGTLKKPMLIVGNYTGGAPVFTLGGVTLTADADYFASPRTATSELWVTLNRDLTGPANQIDITSAAGGGVPTAPTGLNAGAITSTRIDLAWIPTAGAQSYEVDRKAPAGAFVQIGSPASPSYSDLTAFANTSYLYRVRAVNASGASASSVSDLATTVVFTDPALSGLSIKAVHLSQLRTAVDAVRSLAGMGAAVVTDPATAGTIVRAVHLTELRSALDAARSALSLGNSAYTDAALAGVTCRSVHFQELRDLTQ